MAAKEGLSVLEVVTVVALFVGPVLAVVVQLWREARGESRKLRLQVFKTLMATRGTLLSVQHVEALNRIELEFSDRGQADQAVIERWKEYLLVLNDAQGDQAVWAAARINALTELLHTMGASLGYKLDRVTIKSGAYIPRYHGQLEEDAVFMRQSARRLFEGTFALPIEIRAAAHPVMPVRAEPGGAPA